jgi:hypothetical protein
MSTFPTHHTEGNAHTYNFSSPEDSFGLAGNNGAMRYGAIAGQLTITVPEPGISLLGGLGLLILLRRRRA